MLDGQKVYFIIHWNDDDLVLMSGYFIDYQERDFGDTAKIQMIDEDGNENGTMGVDYVLLALSEEQAWKAFKRYNQRGLEEAKRNFMRVRESLKVLKSHEEILKEKGY